jgi:hypothetical protein
MDATTYTGNGSTQTVVNTDNGTVGFKPDFVWIKSRSSGTYEHELFDSVRGIYNYLSSNSTAAESNNTATLTAFNTNGFSVGSGGYNNANGSTYVGWQWVAGQGVNNTNNAGTITTTVSVNTTTGFSIIKYVGNGSTGTIGHGLGVAPQLVIVRRYNAALDWITWHTSIPITQSLLLNTTDAATTSTDYFNSTAPTSTVISLGLGNGINGTAYNNICYAWAPVAGFSAFGSYTGNASADGPFVYTGFRPKFVMIKNSSSASDWLLLDTSRNTYNVANAALFADLSNAEDTSVSFLDILSNGFKVRFAGGAGINASGSTFIYAAFAENPFKYANAR